MLYVQSFFFSLHFYLVVHFEMNEKKKKQQTRDKSKQKRTHNHTHMCGVWRNIHLRFPLEWFFYMRYMNWSGRDHKSTDLELTYCIVSIVSCGRCRRHRRRRRQTFNSMQTRDDYRTICNCLLNKWKCRVIDHLTKICAVA